MANTSPNPPVLPDPNTVASGQRLKDPTPTYLAEVCNHLLSELRADPVITQSWVDDLCRFSDAAGTATDVATWRFPLISDTHLTATIYLNMSCSGLGGKVLFTSAGGSYTDSVAPTATASTWYTLTGFTVGAIASTDYDEITMAIQATTAQEITINSITVEYDRLVLPGAALPAPAIDGVYPLGTTSFGPDYALTASKGTAILDIIRAVESRPRVLFQWTGLSAAVDAYVSPSSSVQVMGQYEHASWNRANDDDGRNIQIWAKVVPNATVDLTINISGKVITVPSGPSPIWVELDSDASAPLRGLSYKHQSGSREFRELVTRAASFTTLGETPASGAPIQSLVAWAR